MWHFCNCKGFLYNAFNIQNVTQNFYWLLPFCPFISKMNWARPNLLKSNAIDKNSYRIGGKVKKYISD